MLGASSCAADFLSLAEHDQASSVMPRVSHRFWDRGVFIGPVLALHSRIRQSDCARAKAKNFGAGLRAPLAVTTDLLLNSTFPCSLLTLPRSGDNRALSCLFAVLYCPFQIKQASLTSLVRWTRAV